MGKNLYAGGHTVIGDHTPKWFGDGHPEQGGAEELRFLRAQKKLEDLRREGKEGRKGTQFRAELKAATRELEAAEESLRNADRPTNIPRAAEQDIADVRKQVIALASRARSAMKDYEDERERLERMVRAMKLDPAKYLEIRRIDLSEPRR